MSTAVTRRGAMLGSAVAALGLVAGVAAVQAAPILSANDARLIELADAFADLRQQEHDAWGALGEDDFDNGPETEACRKLSVGLKRAGEALAGVPACTSAGLAAKASALLPMMGPRLDTAYALSEHEGLVVSILRDVARLGGGAHA